MLRFNPGPPKIVSASAGDSCRRTLRTDCVAHLSLDGRTKSIKAECRQTRGVSSDRNLQPAVCLPDLASPILVGPALSCILETQTLMKWGPIHLGIRVSWRATFVLQQRFWCGQGCIMGPLSYYPNNTTMMLQQHCCNDTILCYYYNLAMIVLYGYFK